MHFLFVFQNCCEWICLMKNLSRVARSEDSKFHTPAHFSRKKFRIFDYLRLREQKIVQFIVLSEIWIKMGKKSRTFQRNWKEGGYPLEKCKSPRTMYGSWSHNLTQLKSYSTDHEGPFPRRSEIFKILHTSTRHSKFGMCMKKYKGLVTPN